MNRPDAPLRLNGRDRLGLLALLAIGAACLAISLKLFPTVFPEATIKFDVDRKTARAKAESILKEMDLDVSGYRYASSFVYDDSAKVFLERELGLEQMNAAVAKTAKIWRWSNRWFRPLEKEEVRVEIAPTGETVRIDHVLPEDAPGGRLTEQEALVVAEDFLSRIRPGIAGELRYLGSTATDLKNRTDRTFTWERIGIDWNGGTYRHRVVVQGQKAGGYEEFVHVPEAWSRGYQQLRSRNNTAGAVDSVFFIITILAMIVVIFLRFRGHQIRWRFAITFGLVAAVLSTLTSMNAIPQDLYNFDTTRSFGGFVAAKIINSLLQGLVIGAMILVVTAAGETIYRSAYPRKMALPRIFTWHGVRTKEFFFSTLGGIIVTFFFIAYQCVFYRVATSLGAWSPADVPYDDLLNSAFPWAFLLFIGFLPAVSEEFMSRAFSIPFFGKILHSRIVGLLLASFIWGFGHATYPNQPFYIRGLEVGIAGVVIGLLMIRFNLLFALVWHFTVDAFLSGYLLLRSGNPYYVVTAAAAGGIMILPFIVSLVAYLRTRTFSDPEPLRHGAERAPEEELAAPPEPIGREAVREPLAVVEAPLSVRRAAVAVVVTGAILAVLFAVTAGFKEPETPIRIDRAAAVAMARSFLGDRGIPLQGYRTVADFGAAADPVATRYVLGQAGLAGLRNLYPEELPAQVWTVRMFKPLDAQELRVRIEATTGMTVGFEHRIAEGDSLGSVTGAEAERLATGLLGEAGLSTAGMERKEAADEPRPKRMDRRYAWEAADGDARNLGEARYRLEAKVAGNEASGFAVRLRVPEAFERIRERRTTVTGIVIALLIAGALGCIGVALRDASRAHLAGRIPWRRMLRVGVVGIFFALAGAVNGWPRFLFSYQTTVAWGSYMVLFFVGLTTAVVIYFFLGWVLTALARGLQPSIARLGDPPALRRMIPGALLALVLVPAWGKALGLVRLLLAGILPRAANPPDLVAGGGLDMLSPGLAVALSTIVSTFLAGFIVAALLRVLGSADWPGRGARFALFAAAAAGIALSPARGLGEGILDVSSMAILLVVAFGMIRWILRGNPLAYLAGLYGFFAFRGVGGLLRQPVGWMRWQGMLGLALLLIPVVWIAVRSRAEAGRPPA